MLNLLYLVFNDKWKKSSIVCPIYKIEDQNIVVLTGVAINKKSYPAKFEFNWHPKLLYSKNVARRVWPPSVESYSGGAKKRESENWRKCLNLAENHTSEVKKKTFGVLFSSIQFVT